ncbi:hypothetical protein MLD38_017663 [Melastoma candidum]|uniref:Uncharacterized protein n=1 Tax=Melastoma candidum TaxID=119954 RepID=A0ACB9QSG9_9MYRT|nr:hypothetical protein MLD38_017663 [Melastoma candidum]
MKASTSASIENRQSTVAAAAVAASTTSAAVAPSTGDGGGGGGGGGASSVKKVRKPYTITKSRESWTEEEHYKFLEALQLFDRDWKKIEDFVGSKSVIQIRSHAQKYFLKVQKNGTVAHLPPPRPKRKAAHPYPQKAPKNGLLPLQPSMAQPSSMNNAFALTPGQILWDEASLLMNKNIPGPNEIENFPDTEVDVGSKGVARVNSGNISSAGTSCRMLCSSEKPKPNKQAPVLHGLPDFSEVYNFIGSVFDPDIEDHVQKLKKLDPINFETVLLLMKNLTFNLSSPDFEPVRQVLSSYDAQAKTVGISLGAALASHGARIWNKAAKVFD